MIIIGKLIEIKADKYYMRATGVIVSFILLLALPPLADAQTNTVYVCIGQTSMLSMTRSIGCSYGVGSNVTWEGAVGGTINDPGGDATDFTVTWATAGTYRFKRDFPDGCAAPYILSGYYTVVAKPATPLSSELTQQAACGEAALKYTGTNNVFWQISSGGFDERYPGTKVVNTPGTYYARAKTNGCWGDAKAFSVSSIPPASIGGTLSGGGTFEESVNKNLTLTGYNGTIIEYWYKDNTSSATPVLIANTSAQLPISITNTGTTIINRSYWAVVRLSSCAEKTSSVTTVVVNPPPNPSMFVCVGETTNHTITRSIGCGNGTGSDATFDGNGGGTINDPGEPADQFTVTWTTPGIFRMKRVFPCDDPDGNDIFVPTGWIQVYANPAPPLATELTRQDIKCNEAKIDYTGPSMDLYWQQGSALEQSKQFNKTRTVTVAGSYYARIHAPSTGCWSEGVLKSVSNLLLPPLGGSLTGGGLYQQSVNTKLVLSGWRGTITLYMKEGTNGTPTVINGNAVGSTIEIPVAFTNPTGSTISRQYYASTTLNGCTATSNIAYVSVEPAPPPVGGTLSGTATYQGYINDQLLLTDYSGTIKEYWYQQDGGAAVKIAKTTNSIRVTMSNNTSLPIVREYWAVVERAETTVTSSKARLTINPLPAFTRINVSYTCTSGGTRVTLQTDHVDDRWYDGEGTQLSTTNSYEVPLTESVYYAHRTNFDGSVVKMPYQIDHTFAERCSNHLNSIKIYKPQLAMTNILSSHDANTVQRTISYLNGVGMTLQDIAIAGSPKGFDVITPHVYDANGREHRQYLPFVQSQNGGQFVSVNYTTGGNYTHNFYNTANDDIPDDIRPFSETTFEASPLSRPVKQFGPGNDWFTNSKSINHTYLLNVFDPAVIQKHERIIAWEINTSGLPERRSAVNGVVAAGGYYTSNNVSIKSTKDEHGNEVREYTDGEGNLILKKVQAVTTPTLDDESHWAQTYYIYDVFGSLTFVLQPELSKKILADDEYNPNSTDLVNFAFQYKYDARKRMIKKKIPGADWVFMVYDRRDRLVLSQDGNQRAASPKEWTFIKYDAFNRPVITGITADNTAHDVLQLNVDNFYTEPLASGRSLFETYTGSGSFNGYDNKSYPQVSSSASFLTVTYYDRYDSFIAPSGFEPVTQNLPGEIAGNQDLIRGQVTATLVKNLTTSAMMRSVNYYDDKYRLIQSVSDHQKGTVRVSNVYDFTGKVLYTKRSYSVNTGSATQRTSIKETYVYDHAGRLLVTKHSINDAPDVVISANYYNEIGHLVSKGLHSNFDPPIDNTIGQTGTSHAPTLTRNVYSSSENKLIATSSVRLTPGFHVPAGSGLIARIGFTKAEAMATLKGVFNQTVDYRYNIRGWLTRINNTEINNLSDDNATLDHFGMELSYEQSIAGLTTTPQYNGNISAIRWSKGAGISNDKQAYTYSYDEMNRLKAASHFDQIIGSSVWASNGNAYGESVSSYDMNGNINSLNRKGVAGADVDNLSYNYTGNQLNYVHDSGDANTGFVNANTGTDDYAYDANGNLKKDKNKALNNDGDIGYNHLNLPKKVIKGSEWILYGYDATGKKLFQEVYSNNGSVIEKRTDYIGELIFEGQTSPTLQFINHTEGRVIPNGNTWAYEYFLKDHLGNVRVTFTTASQTPLNYTANFEIGTTNSGEGVFENYSSSTFDLVDHTDAGTVSTKVQWLNGGANGRIGVTKSLEVMPGDEITATAYAKYINLSSNNNPNLFINALTSVFGVSSASTGEALNLYNGLNSYASYVPLGDHLGDDDDLPKAFINILFFDKHYNLVDAAWDQIGTSGLQSSSTVKEPPHDLMTVTAKAAEAGYAFIFISNEHPTYVDVYFDDLSVSHTPSPVVSINDYYPFGLTYNSYSRENSVPNQYQNTGREKQDELGLNWIDFGSRSYMPDIGRWNALDDVADAFDDESPYSYAANNPVNVIDIGGYFRISAEFANKYPTLTKMIAHYLPLLKANSTVKNAWMKITGGNSDQFDEMVTYGSGPEIVPTDPSKASIYNQRDPYASEDSQFSPKHPDKIFIAPEALEELEQEMKAAMNGQGNEVGPQMFYVSMKIMHEAAHYGVFKHKGAKAFWALEGNPRFGDQGAAWEKNAYKQFSYKSEASPSMNKGEVYDYYKKNYNSDRMLGMTLHHESWFNTMILAPTSGTSAPAKKKKPDADRESSKRSGGAH